MSLEQVLHTKQGVVVDGSKAERELGLRYTPIRVAVKKTVAALE
jgi:hypothetical protein